MLNRSLRSWTFLAFALLFAPLAFAAETGTLKARVLDSDGLPMPGVTVTAKSPNLIGSRMTVTSANGDARIPRLAPGLYTVTAELAGFGRAISEDVRVSLEVTSNLEMTLQSTAGDTVTVQSDYPVIDTTTPMVADHIRLETVEALPVGRDYVAYMQLVSGVNMVANAQGVDTPSDPAGKGGLNYRDRGGFEGSRDNMYVLDGVNITGMSSQTSGLTFNNEVIQEQEIISSGVPAEYAGGKGIVFLDQHVEGRPGLLAAGANPALRALAGEFGDPRDGAADTVGRLFFRIIIGQTHRVCFTVG